MGKASIHIQKASGGAITHNSRENYSKSVVFKDEKNELWNDKKSAFQIYREELKNRVEAYTNRTNQKLQKTAVTHLSAVVNLEQHHTLKDLENIKEELEKVFDTKVFQMAIHRDEGKIKHKETGEYLVSGIDFFYNEQDNKYYTKKDKNKYENELNIYEYDIEKNYHAHIEFMGLDSQGQAIRQKMNRFVLSNLQDFTAQTLNMERGNNYQIKKSAKRLDTHDYKAEKKAENEVKKVVKNEKNKIVKKANEIINSEREDKKKLKEDLDFVKNEFKSIREMLKGTGATREDFKKIDDLNKQLQNDLKNNDIDLEKATEEIKNLLIDLKLENKIKDEKVKELTSLAFSNVLYNNTNDRVPYKVLNENKKKKLKEKDEMIEKLNEKIKGYDSQINKIEILEKQIDDLLLDMQTKVAQIEKLEKANKDLQEQNKTLENKVSTLEAKSIPTQTMSDYEAIKKENESLKKENSFLKRVVEKVLNYANYKIKELINFGKPQFKKSVSFEDFASQIAVEDMASKASAYSKKDLDETVKRLQEEDNHNQKKEDLDYFEHHSNLRQR